MKIKEKVFTIDQVLKLPRAKHRNPCKQNFILKNLMYLLSQKDLKEVGFTYICDDISKTYIKNQTPCLILMNHSCFLDLEMVSKIFYPHPYSIVCTSDALVGKETLMRHLGCIPTSKYVTDITLIQDIRYALHQLRSNVLMYPEAGYSLDGCATTLPSGFGRLLQMLKVPVIFIQSFGAFARDPLYNNLQKRQVKVSAKVSCLFQPDELSTQSVAELDMKIQKAFTFDSFRWQADNNISISENFRADGLERVLYRCPSCQKEGTLFGKGTEIVCTSCGKKHTLNEFGRLTAADQTPDFEFVSDWFRWERETVKKELEDGSYHLETDVDIRVLTDYKALYSVGEGRLVHSSDGFQLTGCDGKINFHMSPLASFGLNVDYFWYEIGDIICIGNKDILYYCFPKTNTPVAKARLAAEELYKICKKKQLDLREKSAFKKEISTQTV